MFCQGKKQSFGIYSTHALLCLLNLVTSSTLAPSTITWPPIPSLALPVCIPSSPPQISRPFGKQEAAFCVRSHVVLCRSILIGPGKAGNYSSLVRDVSGLSLALTGIFIGPSFWTFLGHDLTILQCFQIQASFAFWMNAMFMHWCGYILHGKFKPTEAT